MRNRILVATAVALALSAPAFGQSQPPSSAQSSGQQPANQALQQSQQAQQSLEQLAAQGDKVIGKDLYGANQEKVGSVKDVVVGPDGKLKAVLVDVGGFLGIGAKTVAVPTEQLTVKGEQVVAANLTKQTAESMPEYKDQPKQPQQQGR